MFFCLHVHFRHHVLSLNTLPSPCFRTTWGGWQVSSRGPPCCAISWNAYLTCHFESNHYYPCLMCSTQAGLEYDLLKARQQRCCFSWTKTQHTPAEHRGRGAHQKIDVRYQTVSPRTRRSSSFYRRSTAQLQTG